MPRRCTRIQRLIRGGARAREIERLRISHDGDPAVLIYIETQDVVDVGTAKERRGIHDFRIHEHSSTLVATLELEPDPVLPVDHEAARQRSCRRAAGILNDRRRAMELADAALRHHEIAIRIDGETIDTWKRQLDLSVVDSGRNLEVVLGPVRAAMEYDIDSRPHARVADSPKG